MTDTVSRESRSRTMAAIRSSNTGPEVRFGIVLQESCSLGFNVNDKSLTGCPDFVFPGPRVTVFLDSCFWHGCPKHLRLPSSNVHYWIEKIGRNIERDKVVSKQLRKEGWKVVRVWEHELKDEQKLLRRLLKIFD